MSREEAIEIVKRWVEHKMLWFDDSSFENKYIVHQAINMIGVEEVDKITKQLKAEWDE